MPPGFSIECDLAQEALVWRSEYREQRLIRMPMRERTLEEYFGKKEKEYDSLRKVYQGLFDPTGHRFLRQYPQTLITRKKTIGNEIIHSWEEKIDEEPFRCAFSKLKNSKLFESIRNVPRILRDNGVAVTWVAIQNYIQRYIGAVDVRELRLALQHFYFSSYVEEFDLRVITHLPFSRHDFWLAQDDLYYDYDAVKGALCAVGLWMPVCSMSAYSMVSIRLRAGYFAFKSTFRMLSNVCASVQQIINVFALARRAIREAIKKTSFIEKHFPEGLSVPNAGLRITEEELDAIDSRLLSICHYIETHVSDFIEPSMTKVGAVESARRSSVKKPVVAIFVALEMERKILLKRWNLTGKYPDPWRGNLGSSDIIVFGPNEMGRVPAAIATMDLLAKSVPDLLFVVGIAGGLEKEGVMPGDIIVGSSVADLAIRKIRQNEEGVVPEFRPKEFRTDNRLVDYLTSGSFKQREWEESVIDKEEWPGGRRPQIVIGTLACTDEVVSSDKWIEQLYSSWPTLRGIEMESGGVCAAAEKFNVKISVIRGVSDNANPVKSDNEWRRIAMKTVANLLEAIDFPSLLCT